MRKLAQFYSQKGYNCSQCILMAAAKKYHLDLSDTTLSSCHGITNGFGIGTICSAVVGGVMVLGIMFQEEVAKSLRLQLLSRMQEKYGNLNCCVISADLEECHDILGDVAQFTEELILQAKEST